MKENGYRLFNEGRVNWMIKVYIIFIKTNLKDLFMNTVHVHYMKSTIQIPIPGKEDEIYQFFEVHIHCIF